MERLASRGTTSTTPGTGTQVYLNRGRFKYFSGLFTVLREFKIILFFLNLGNLFIYIMNDLVLCWLW